MESLINDDTKAIFNDWGQLAILEEVESYYDPDTARMEESSVTTSLNILPGTAHSQALGQTVAQRHEVTEMFIVHEDDLPLNVNLVTARLIFDDRIYKVEAITQSHLPATIVLECVCES